MVENIENGEKHMNNHLRNIYFYMCVFVIVLLLVLAKNSRCQEYVYYFNNCNEADKAYYYKNYDSALLYYENAFAHRNYVHNKYLVKASYCSSKLHQFDKTNLYLKKAFLQGVKSSLLKQKVFRKFRATKYYTNLIDSIGIFEVCSERIINQHYREMVDSLFFIDQNIVRGNYRDTIKCKIPASGIQDYLQELDSLNFVMLLNLIEQYGYPSEKLIGEKSYENASILLLHSIRKPWNSKYLELMRNALYHGECLPVDYAWTVDQSCEILKIPMQFYYGERNPNKLSKDQKIIIDNERKKFGIKPLEAFRVIEIFNILITAPKW